MKLTETNKSDTWTVSVNGVEGVNQLSTRGEVYNFVRAARMLGFPDDTLSITRLTESEYGFEGD